MRHSHETKPKIICAYVVWLKQPESSSEVVNITNVTWKKHVKIVKFSGYQMLLQLNKA